MSAEVKILVEGHTNADYVTEVGEETTQPTITLVRDGEWVIVVDPGVLESQQVLIDALVKEKLKVNDVNLVCITHSHIDHYRNIGMFPNAKTLEFFGLWNKNSVVDWSENFTANTKVLRTPGHDYTDITLLVTTINGTVAICGDVFWKEGFPHDPHDDLYALNPEKLKESRHMIMKVADWIIPGHGGMYKNNLSAATLEEALVKREDLGAILKCKKCNREMMSGDRCRCRPSVCIKHCECGFDCPVCGCSHKSYQKI